MAGLIAGELFKVVAFGGYATHGSVHHLIDGFLVIVVGGSVKRLSHGLLLSQMLLKHTILLFSDVVATHAHLPLVVVGMPSSVRKHGVLLD